jgi:hypothetical protein
MLAHSSSYIKDSDRKYGVIVTFRDPKTSKVIGLQCHFCIAFGQEEKVDSKHKAMTKMQGWFAPFCYNNIENHMHTQHRTKWLEYNAIHSTSKRNQFSSMCLLYSRIQSKRILFPNLWVNDSYLQHQQRHHRNYCQRHDVQSHGRS